MVPKKTDWNRVIPVGDGRCHVCRGSKKDPRWGRERTCEECRGSGQCRMCDGTGKNPQDGYHCGYCESNYEAEKKFYEAVGKNASIDEVIDAISQETTARRVWKRCDAARESFALDRITVRSRSEYEALLARYMTHYSVKAMFHDRMDPENPFLTAEHYLAKIYGNSKFPYECARSGEAGGMRGLLDSIHEHAKKVLAQRTLENTLDYFDMPERERLLREYIQKYGGQDLELDIKTAKRESDKLDARQRQLSRKVEEIRTEAERMEKEIATRARLQAELNVRQEGLKEEYEAVQQVKKGIEEVARRERTSREIKVQAKKLYDLVRAFERGG